MTGRKRVVLLGMGHTNVHVLREWIDTPLPNTELVCISQFPVSTYSGMLPGTLAGQFAPQDMQIDLQPLVRKASARLLLADVTGLNADRQELEFSDAPPLRFDVASVGVGSMPAGWNDLDSDLAIPIKPMQTFLQRLKDKLAKAASRKTDCLRVIVVGGGAAGIEIALCLKSRLEGTDFVDRNPSGEIEIQLVTSGNEIAAGMSSRSRQLLVKVLADHGIHVMTNTRVVETTEDAVVTRDGKTYQADAVIWATGAVAPPVLGCLGLPTDERGFLLTHPTLQTIANIPLFAVGDSGTIDRTPFPKAGVFAVRQTPILWHNLQATLAGEPLQEFQPQGTFLKLLNTGKGKALLEYGRISLHARWCMKLKTWIDKRFIAHYQFEEQNEDST